MLFNKEKEMLEAFLNSDIHELSCHVKLTSKQIENILKNKNNIKKFYHISEIEGIGAKTYKAFFDYFYNNRYMEHKNIQLKLHIL